VLFTNGMDVPLHAKIVICVVVVISMTTTYLTVRQSMKRGMMPTNQSGPMGQSQKLMAYIMPLFALTGLYWQFGLVLYWVTTNLWTLGQQYVLLRKYPVGAAAAAADGNIPIDGKAGKPATASGLTSGTKPKPSGGTTGARKTGTGAGNKGGTASAKPTSLNKGSGVNDAKPSSAGKSTSPPKKSSAAATGASSGTAGTTGTAGANGHKPGSNEGGVLRRFTKGRSEPEPPPAPEPETKIVRQQRQRQSRSKRSGKR
jgi:hypothetical protein